MLNTEHNGPGEGKKRQRNALAVRICTPLSKRWLTMQFSVYDVDKGKSNVKGMMKMGVGAVLAKVLRLPSVITYEYAHRCSTYLIFPRC